VGASAHASHGCSQQYSLLSLQLVWGWWIWGQHPAMLREVTRESCAATTTCLMFVCTCHAQQQELLEVKSAYHQQKGPTCGDICVGGCHQHMAGSCSVTPWHDVVSVGRVLRRLEPVHPLPQHTHVMLGGSGKGGKVFCRELAACSHRYVQPRRPLGGWWQCTGCAEAGHS
jgi:hypothetical protein